MSKNLAGLASADLTLNSLSLVEITATNLTASSTTTTTDLSVSNNATISGNLQLGALTDVEQAIEDAGEDFSAGTGLTLDTTQTPNVLNFTGGDIGTAHITTSGDIRGGTLKYLDPIPSDSNNHSDVKTKIDNLELVGTTNTSNIATNTSNIALKADNFQVGTALNFDTSTTPKTLNATNTISAGNGLTLTNNTIDFTGGNLGSMDITLTNGGSFATNGEIDCFDLTTNGFIRIIDLNTTPVSHTYGIIQSANSSNGLDLELEADGNINLKNKTTKNITLSTSNTTKKHIVCNGTNFDTKLYFDNAEKLATTTNGIDITGGITCDGLTTQNGAILGGDITTTSITQTGTTTNTFFGDVNVVKGLFYADTEGNSGTLQNVKTKIDDLNNNKQDTLTAGDNIGISNNTISVASTPQFSSLNIFSSSFSIGTEPSRLAFKSLGASGMGFFTGSGTATERLRLQQNGRFRFYDDVRAVFGDSSDLQIYYNPSANAGSIIEESVNNRVQHRYRLLNMGVDGNLNIDCIEGTMTGGNTETISLQTYIDNKGRLDTPTFPNGTQHRHVMALQKDFGLVLIGAGTIQDGNAKLQIKTNQTNSPNGGGLSINGQTGKNGVIQVVSGSNGKDVDGISFKASNNDNHIINFVNTSGGQRGKIDGVDSSTVNYDTGSDRRLKTNIQDMDSQLDNIMNLRPRKYNWIEDNKEGNGFIAQEIHEIYPQFREKYEDTYCADNDEFDEDCPCDASGNEYYYGLDYGKFTPYIIQAFQEFKDMYDNKIAELETRISLLENN
jgi:hypothetical protein